MPVGNILNIASWQDLLKKCQSDFERMRASPLDSYASFDFFVTARHVPDWMYPDDKAGSNGLFDAHVELRICRHIADGAKHLVLTSSMHKQVQGAYETHSMFGNMFGNLFGNTFGENALCVGLDATDPDTRKYGSSITSLKLADEVLKVLNHVVP
jgi:hypothetical protein